MIYFLEDHKKLFDLNAEMFKKVVQEDIKSIELIV